MIKHWTLFEGKPFGADRGEARVTLGRGNVIYMNNKAFDALEQPAAVQMMFDGNRRIIGVKPVDANKKYAFRVKFHTKSYKRINISAFCQHFRLKCDSTLLFTNVEFESDGTMTLPLDTAVTVNRGSR